jgi:SSS family solute:Na+ symporter
MENSPFAFMNSHVLLDVVILLVYFSVVIGIGLSQRSKNDTVEGFALGDRQTPWWAVLASIIAAEISAATFLGAPDSGFEHRNWIYLQLAIGSLMARIIVSFLFIPLFYRQGVVSLYEFLGTRFGPRTRVWASATFLFTRVLAMGARLYVSAIILVIAYQSTQATEISADQKFWIYTAAVVLVTVFTALYTSIGGLRAVIWTDFIQVGVLIAALGGSIYILLTRIPGGWDAVAAHIEHPAFVNLAKPTEPDFTAWMWLRNILTTENTIWAAFIGSTFITMATHGIDQDTVQRMLSAKNRRESAKATILSGLVDIPVVASFILVGVLVSTYYHGQVQAGYESREMFPYFIIHETKWGLRGLVIAGVMAAAMGSLSTALNALGTSFARDFVIPRRERLGPISEHDRVRVLRGSTVLFAGLIILVGVSTAHYAVHHPKAGIIGLVMGILFTFGPLLALFLVGVLTKTRGNDFGNLLAMIVGFAVVLFFSNGWVQSHTLSLFGASLATNADGELEPWLVLSFPWRITLGTLLTFAIAVCFPSRKVLQNGGIQPDPAAR